MIAMAAKERVRKVYARTTGRLKASLDRVVLAVRSSEVFANRDERPSQEAIINASWLWMADMDPEELSGKLAPYIAKFEAVWEKLAVEEASRAAKDEPDSAAEVVDEQPKRQRRKA